MANKNRAFLVRLSEYESRQLSYVSARGGISRSEVLRAGLQTILQNSPPSENPKLKKFYREVL